MSIVVVTLILNFITMTIQPINAKPLIIEEVFDKKREIDSTGKEYSDDKYWWVSKGEFEIKNDMGYIDVDKFRAMIKHEFDKKTDFQVKFYFKYEEYFGNDGTDSIGLYFNHKDEQNKYSVGIRADGYSEIKEKNDGKYSENHNTVRVFDKNGDGQNKIPENKWIGVKIIVEQKSGYNHVKLYVDKGNYYWQFVTEWKDTSDLIRGGEVGMRVDGYDVFVKDFQIQKI